MGVDMNLRKRCIILSETNSCRSQIAEAIVNKWAYQHWEAFSAGTQPAASVHPMALKVLTDIGINHQGEAKPISQFRDQVFELVIVIKDDPIVICPEWLEFNKRMHVSFPDPVMVAGTPEEQLKIFRRLRNDIFFKILNLLMDYPQRSVSI